MRQVSGWIHFSQITSLDLRAKLHQEVQQGNQHHATCETVHLRRQAHRRVRHAINQLMEVLPRLLYKTAVKINFQS